MHEHTPETERLAVAIYDLAHDRLLMDPPPLDRPHTHEALTRDAGATVVEDGLGGDEALRIFRDVLAPACISSDHPRYLAFIPGAPTEAATLFDLVVGASSIEASSWLLGAGVIYAENQALRWLADLAGFPESAGGVFVQGGTLGNLSALVAARHRARERRGGSPARWQVAATPEAHSSIGSATSVMDVDLVAVEPDADGRLRGDALRRAVRHAGGSVFAVVATAGTTNLGIVDRLDEVADACNELGIWLHVDGAYGGAALPRPRFAPSSTGSSGPTRSSSTRTSGFSRPTTAARSSIATQLSRGRPTCSAPVTWIPSSRVNGTPPTTRST